MLLQTSFIPTIVFIQGVFKNSKSGKKMRKNEKEPPNIGSGSKCLQRHFKTLSGLSES